MISVQNMQDAISNSFPLARADQPGKQTKYETQDSFQKILNQVEGEPTNSTPASSEERLPLESYSLPSWFGTYLPEQSTLTSGLNHGFWEFVEKLAEDNVLTDEERMQLSNYLSSDLYHQKELEKRAFREEFKVEIGEYYDLLDTIFQDLLKENGIESNEDYYRNVILDKEKSEKLHMEMEARIKSNPRILELMDVF